MVLRPNVSGLRTALQLSLTGYFPNYFLISQWTTLREKELDSLLYSEAKQTAYVIGTNFQILMFQLKHTMYCRLVCIVWQVMTNFIEWNKVYFSYTTTTVPKPVAANILPQQSTCLLVPDTWMALSSTHGPMLTPQQRLQMHAISIFTYHQLFSALIC